LDSAISLPDGLHFSLMPAVAGIDPSTSSWPGLTHRHPRLWSGLPSKAWMPGS